ESLPKVLSIYSAAAFGSLSRETKARSILAFLSTSLNKWTISFSSTLQAAHQVAQKLMMVTWPFIDCLDRVPLLRCSVLTAGYMSPFETAWATPGNARAA